MKDNESFKRAVSSINNNKKYPALKLVKDNPELAATISKLVKPLAQQGFDITDSKSHYNLNQNQLNTISEDIKHNIQDNKNIMQLFPDIELAVQILVSSILSPKDMTSSSLIYKNSGTIVSNDLTMKLNSLVETVLTTNYEILSKLEPMLRDTLFTTGSYVEAVLPESIVDQIINQNISVSTESLSELFTDDKTTHLGILGNSGKPKKTSAISIESMLDTTASYKPGIATEDAKLDTLLGDLVEVSDNYKLLKLPLVNEAINKSKLKQVLKPSRSIGVEDQKLTDKQLASTLYKNASNKSEQFLVLPSKANLKRKSVGRPLIMRLPSESVIPVYIPGDETRHVGYFVMIDIDGNPVTLESNQGCSGGLTSLNRSLSGNNDNNSLSSMLINKAKKNLVDNSTTPTLDQVTEIYSSIVEKDLVERLHNGLYKSELSISNSNDIYRVMLARSLAGHFTRLVYIPAELVSYFAFKHHDNGVGKSLLDDIKILTSLRAIIMFSKVMAMTKSSIALTRVNMTLDPNDPDPQKTIELATHEVAKTRQQYFPLGINSPTDLVDWIQRAGFEFTFEGHPGLPETKFDFETKNIQHELPDSELDELLRKQTYMAFGLSPEVVDNGFTGDFATTVVANNILLSKRIIQLQASFTRTLSQHIRRIIINDPIVIDSMMDLLKENQESLLATLDDDEKVYFKQDPDNFLSDVLERYVETILVELPKPDETTLTNQSEAYDLYEESLEKALDAWINSDTIDPELTGDISDNIEPIRSAVKNYYLRKWMSENGYMTELADITLSDEDGNPFINIYNISKTHIEGLIKSSADFVEALAEVKADVDDQLENIGTVEEEELDTDSTDENIDDFETSDGDTEDDVLDDTLDEEPDEDLDL